MKRYVETNYVFEPFKMAKQQQTTKTVMYSWIYRAGWPSGLRRKTQENFSLEISGTRMCAWVRIPLLSEVFKHCEVSHELKTMQNQKQFCFWKLSGIRTRLESSGSKLLLHQSVPGFKTYPCKNTKIKLMHLVKCTFLHWQSWLFDDQLVPWKMKFQKIEAICQNKLRIWTVQRAKTTANNPNNNVHYIPQGRMAKRSKAPDSRKLLAQDFWYTNVCVDQIPLLSEVFKHCEVSHELKKCKIKNSFAFES